MTSNEQRAAAEPLRLIYGCMRIAGDGSAAARARGLAALDAAFAAGIRHFDHADIYADGACETLFGEWLRAHPGRRDDLTIISKCGIRRPQPGNPPLPQHYDFSPGHIEASVAGSLERLGIDRLDMLLLHRPDYLMAPDAVADCLAKLHAGGAIASAGVSNFSISQLRLLASKSHLPLAANQIEFSLAEVRALDNGLLDTCLELGVVPQAWSPLAGAVDTHRRDDLAAAQRQSLALELQRQADVYALEAWQIALCWLLAHPAGVVPVIGTLTPERIDASVDALSVAYDHVDWYRLLEARNGHPVP
ncbi:MAG: aldo/keto reductase [Pseudomonadota bacterium]